MVNDSGQLYSMEGVAAGLIMIVTAYFVLNTTSIYTPGDAHIIDMQLEQLANDALAMMDTPAADGDDSALKTFVASNDSSGFRDEFLDYCGLRAGGTDTGLCMNATVAYRSGETVGSYVLNVSGVETGMEPSVRVSRLVQLDGTTGAAGMDNRKQVALVEVRIWRG
ncbi:hypothetical protein FGU65_13725 [Methanoculleus sp. FWC-SCC1]|uniref:Type 4 fimbrial biogenesis protein PilX N-terminal domain-containing protein n=1 Tax=Methanoculleus frigidifontis TaxID=2584085 RepID=A0ABT8MDA3_9EURY|nr:hypothetical protein [Methanoculleus sp. FWC-SCC1]MDN7025929.1 hypothetical protein [Methanoculleus sp. FWC-SCC1]